MASYSKGIILFAVLPAIFVPFISSLFYFLIFKKTQLIQVLYFITKLFVLLWPFYAIYFIFGSKIHLSSLLNFRQKPAIVSGLLYCFFVILLIAILMQTALGKFIVVSGENITNKAKLFGFIGYYWVFALFLFIFNSLFEEFYWRWFVYGILAKTLRLRTAQLVAAAAFSAHHFIILIYFFGLWIGFIFGTLVLVGGLMWCKMYEKYRSLAGNWISHFLVDVGIMTVGHKIIFGTYFF